MCIPATIPKGRTDIKKRNQSIKKFDETLKKHGIVPLAGSCYVNTKTAVRVKILECGHIIDLAPYVLYGNIERSNGKYRCPKCLYESQRMTEEKAKDYIKKATQGEYKLHSFEPPFTTKKKVIFFHKTCGRTFEATFTNFKQGRRCPHCAQESTDSNAAKLIKRLLEHVGIEFEHEKSFEGLENPLTGFSLRYDIFLPELNTVIEIDGEQHFRPVERFGGVIAFQNNVFRDYIKTTFAMKNNLKLIRLSLFDREKQRKKRYEDVKKEIFNLLYRLVQEKKALAA